MRPPRLTPEEGFWQILIVDPKGRWVHQRVDILLVELARLGPAAYIAAEAETAAERLFRQQEPTYDQR